MAEAGAGGMLAAIQAATVANIMPEVIPANTTVNVIQVAIPANINSQDIRAGTPQQGVQAQMRAEALETVIPAAIDPLANIPWPDIPPNVARWIVARPNVTSTANMPRVDRSQIRLQDAWAASPQQGIRARIREVAR